MALKAASVLALPDLACQGFIKKVGNVKLSDKGVYHVLPIEVEGKYAARDGVFFFIFEPRWFGASFDPEVLKDELDSQGRPIKYRMYLSNINGEGRPSALVSLLHEDFEAFSDELTEEDPTPEGIADLLREVLTGREVLYIMKQSKDSETGALMDRYNIQSFYAPTTENVEYLQKQADNPKRKTPLVVTWEEE